MNLIGMVDELLRDRGSLYQQARQRERLRPLCMRLLVFFLLSSAIYGAVMGAYRSFHPEFFFSDFELTADDIMPIQGKVAGIVAENHAVYTRVPLPDMLTGAAIRFNITNPSDAYRVTGVGVEKGYNKIMLAPDAVLTEAGRWTQPLMVAAKIPLLLLLTLIVCALALYILNLAFGMKLHFASSMTLMLFALAGTGVMLVVFAPIALLFTVVTTSYHFMKIMHVIVVGISGRFGVRILYEGLMNTQAPEGDEVQGYAATGRAKLVLFSWLLLYGLVGAQLAWTLKPFLGTPYLPATPPFRLDKGNIFVSTIESFRGIKPAE